MTLRAAAVTTRRQGDLQAQDAPVGRERPADLVGAHFLIDRERIHGDLGVSRRGERHSQVAASVVWEGSVFGCKDATSEGQMWS